jgi:hypothetical protein
MRAGKIIIIIASGVFAGCFLLTRNPSGFQERAREGRPQLSRSGRDSLARGIVQTLDHPAIDTLLQVREP